MNNKLYILLVSVLCAAGMVIPAFATNSDVPTDVPIEYEVPTSSEGDSEGGSDELLDCLDESESDSESLEPVLYSGLDGATVNVSDESVSAIADAVSANYESFDLTNKNGSVYPVPVAFVEAWNTYEYHYIFAVSNRVHYCFSNIPITYNPSLRNLYLDGGRGQTYLTSFSVASNFSSVSASGYFSGVNIVESYYSDHDILATDGLLYYASDKLSPPPSYIITFDSGFDDLFVDSQSSLEFSPPSLSKPGYIFLGWCLPDGSLLPSGYEFTSDITLTAKWSEEPPMAFFAESLFNSFSIALESPPIFYLVSLMALAVILGIFKSFLVARI